MDERTQARIFEPFFTTKEVGKGTGLGLSIVYGIIKQHGGYINVVSEPGSGTQFKLYFPLITDPVRVMIPAEPAMPEVGRATILVAEDDDAVRMLTRAVLEGFGYTVIEAVDGEDALAQYAMHKEQIDLLVLDIVMPKKSGILVYEEIRKDRSDIKALFTSGYPQEVIRAKGILDESFNFLSKPVSPRGLLKKVKEVLDGRTTSPMTST
jgi:CheY-like chemotaxis protein